MPEKYIGFGDLENMLQEFEHGKWLGDGRYAKDDVFIAAPDAPTDDEIVIACYNQQSYDGDAFVLYRRDGRLYEVNGSHCSCYGLEGQWKPEETTAAALKMQKNSYGARGCAEVVVAIAGLEASQ